MANKIELAYYKVRCIKTGDIVAAHIATGMYDGYEGWLVCNPYRCRFEEISQAECETLQAFLETEKEA